MLTRKGHDVGFARRLPLCELQAALEALHGPPQRAQEDKKKAHMRHIGPQACTPVLLHQEDLAPGLHGLPSRPFSKGLGHDPLEPVFHLLHARGQDKGLPALPVLEDRIRGRGSISSQGTPGPRKTF